MPYSKEQIQDRYNKLPADIREAIDSVSTTNVVVDIGQKYDLMYDQISELVDEVGLTMIGLTPETMFVNNIARRMRVDMSKAMLIARDINKEIFDKMRDSLKKIEDGHEEGEYVENENGVRKNNQFGQMTPAQSGEETMMTDAEKAQKESIVSAVEKAGGFVIDKPNEPSSYKKITEKPESKEDIVNVLELDSAMPPDHLLGDTPEVPTPLQPTSIKQNQTQQSKQNNVPERTVPKQPDQTSIVDTLLSKGVAMTMEEPSKQDTISGKPKVRPYDGTDPYREAVK
jgi:hypothetical protein